MGSFAPQLIGPALAILLVSLGHSLLSALKQLGISRQRLQVSARLNGLVFALFSGIQKIRLAGAEKRAFARWAKVYREEGKLLFAPPVYLRLNEVITLLISGIGAVWLYWAAGAAKVPPADYIAFQVAYGVVAGALQALSGIAATVAETKPVLEMVQPLLETAPECSTARRTVTSLSGAIEINNLTFRYDPGGPAIFDNFSLKVRPREFIAVVGRTGCGKSTLLRLLLGFEKPESGAIYYDGHDLESLDMRSFRRCVGTALQNGRLLTGEIFSNIVLAAPWLSLADAWEAARLAGVDEEIKAMPMGMQTLISEGSGGISGGQRQRILIARALASRPSVLFFDEATSALDNLSQKRIVDNLAALRCTRLVIAHRLSTIRCADRIVVLEGGRIVEDGTYEALMAAKGPFHELAARQTL
jgi:ABC-type bacteriocin/lantibiotic exporter with double-glycine peptidase domain